MRAGRDHGRQAGEEAGRELGLQKGLELGREVGQYRGRVDALLAIAHAYHGFASDRILSTLIRLQPALAAIKLDDPLDQKCFNELDDIRAKMRMVDLWLKGLRSRVSGAGAGARVVSSELPSSEHLSF